MLLKINRCEATASEYSGFKLMDFYLCNLTKLPKISINTIDKFNHVCYNKDKLENKTKILTNKNKNNKNKRKQ